MSNPIPRAERLTDDRPALVACRHCNSYIVDNGGWRMTHIEPFTQVTIICDACVQAAIDLSIAVTLAHAERAAAQDSECRECGRWVSTGHADSCSQGLLRRKLADTPDEERCDGCDTLVPYGTLYLLSGGPWPIEEHWMCGDCLATEADPTYAASSVDYAKVVL